MRPAIIDCADSLCGQAKSGSYLVVLPGSLPAIMLHCEQCPFEALLSHRANMLACSSHAAVDLPFALQIIDVSVIKATNHNKVPPKSKHVQGASQPAAARSLFAAAGTTSSPCMYASALAATDLHLAWLAQCSEVEYTYKCMVALHLAAQLTDVVLQCCCKT